MYMVSESKHNFKYEVDLYCGSFGILFSDFRSGKVRYGINFLHIDDIRKVHTPFLPGRLLINNIFI